MSGLNDLNTNIRKSVEFDTRRTVWKRKLTFCMQWTKGTRVVGSAADSMELPKKSLCIKCKDFFFFFFTNIYKPF